MWQHTQFTTTHPGATFTPSDDFDLHRFLLKGMYSSYTKKCAGVKGEP